MDHPVLILDICVYIYRNDILKDLSAKFYNHKRLLYFSATDTGMGQWNIKYSFSLISNLTCTIFYLKAVIFVKRLGE